MTYDSDAAHGDVSRNHRMNLPHRRVNDLNAFNEDVFRAVRLDEVRPQVMPLTEDALANRHTALPHLAQSADVFGCHRRAARGATPCPLPPILIRSRTVKCAATRYRNVLLPEGINERR